MFKSCLRNQEKRLIRQESASFRDFYCIFMEAHFESVALLWHSLQKNGVFGVAGWPVSVHLYALRRIKTSAMVSVAAAFASSIRCE